MAKIERVWDWVVETYEGPELQYGELLDTLFFDTATRNYSYVRVQISLLNLKHSRVGLQLSEGNYKDGVLFTATSYVNSVGLLDPVTRDDETQEPVRRVPFRFIREVEKHRASPLYRILH